jgi:hypothetical protein
MGYIKIMNHDETRRRFLMAAIVGSGVAASGLSLTLLGISKAWAQSPDARSTQAGLARMARLLYPHEVPDSVYSEVMSSILSAAATDPELKKFMDQAAVELDAATPGGFMAADDEAQLTALRGLEQQPYFAAIQGQVLPRLYNHPVIWQHIGYPGSSVEFGGYKDRGFNDIDWLPADKS